jgi:chromosome segregation ATPase
LRGLRADINRSSAASARVQVLTARLALEEQRLNGMGRQLADLQSRLDDASAKRREAEEGLKQWETAIAERKLPLTQQDDLERMLPSRRADVARLQTSEQQIRADLLGLSSAITSEQGQWTEFSNRLDDLERSLASVH